MSQQLWECARQYHGQLSDRIREYLNGRGITDAVIDRYVIGWSGWRITIPIYDRKGEIAFFKLAKDPNDQGDGPKMLTAPGASAELYGWEHVETAVERILICEGEFDRLVLEGRGIPTVTSTGGALTFRREWAQALSAIRQVYVCFDRDTAGTAGAFHVARQIPNARIVELPADVGEHGDVTDYFVRLGRSVEDFEELLQTARPAPGDVSFSQRGKTERELPEDVRGSLANVRIEDAIARYVSLKPRGSALVGQCPFHEDRLPSLVVYTDTQTFHCFGCRAHGNVVSFVMRAGGFTFDEAIEALRRRAA